MKIKGRCLSRLLIYNFILATWISCEAQEQLIEKQIGFLDKNGIEIRYDISCEISKEGQDEIFEQEFIVGNIRSEIRCLAGQYDYYEICISKRDSIETKIKNTIQENLKRREYQVEEFHILNILIPKRIEAALLNKKIVLENIIAYEN